MVSNSLAIITSRAILMSLLLVATTVKAQVQVSLPWYYSLPSTEEGKQKLQQINLYKSKADYNNVKIVSSYARTIEPGCFSFAESYVEACYNTRQGAQVLKLSDSLSWSELATAETFLYNAWLKEWNRDKNGVFRAIDKGLNLYPDNLALLRGGMQLAIGAKKPNLVNTYGKEILTKYPRDWQAYYEYQKYYDESNLHDYAIIMGELAMAVGANSPKNVEIKNRLINSYNKWLQEADGSKVFSSLSHTPDGLTEIRNMQNILFLQGYMTYRYGQRPASNFLEKRLYEYKFEIIKDCNWIAYYYERFGVSLFPLDYEKYLEENKYELSALNLCLQKIETLH